MVLGDVVHFYQPVAIQLVESKVGPIFAIVLFVLTLIFNRGQSEQARKLSTISFSFAVSYLAFGFFRLILAEFYGGSFWWFLFWEEATELLFIEAIGVIFYVFKKSSQGMPGAQ